MRDGSVDGALALPVLASRERFVIDLAEILTTTKDSSLLARGALELLADTLGAQSGAVNLARRDESDDLLLVSVALIGPHASLLGNVPPVSVAAITEAAEVFRSSVPSFVEDAYRGDGALESTGAARWREQLPAQSRAVVPLDAHGERLGTLALEWGSPREFPDEERKWLVAVASLIGLGLALIEGHSNASTPPRAPVREAVEFGVTAEGVVITPRMKGAKHPALMLSAQVDGAAWVDTYAAAPGRVLVLVAAAGEPENPLDPETIDALRQTARVIAARSDPGAAASALAGRLRELAPANSSVDGWAGIWTPGNGALEHVAFGTAHARLILADGRQLSVDEAPPAGATRSTPGPTTWLPLGGDVLHAWVPGRADMRVEWVAARG